MKKQNNPNPSRQNYKRTSKDLPFFPLTKHFQLRQKSPKAYTLADAQHDFVAGAGYPSNLESPENL